MAVSKVPPIKACGSGPFPVSADSKENVSNVSRRVIATYHALWMRIHDS
jgi:hypothetical protein